MTDPELQKRLDRVSEMLGQKISLIEAQLDSKDESEDDELSSPIDSAQWQRDLVSEADKENSSKQEPEPQPDQEDPDAPKRFFGHDVGPRASVQDAFDNSRFVAGEPIEASAEFCPWKTVTAYPHSYVGNTNRPHVCFCVCFFQTFVLTNIGHSSIRENL